MSGAQGSASRPMCARSIRICRKVPGPSNKWKTSLPDSADSIRSAHSLDEPSKAFARRYPGETGRRQPVHVVYGGAHLFRAGISRRLGELALASLDEFAPDAFTFASAVGMNRAAALPKSAKLAVAAERRFARAPEKLRAENRAAWMALAVYGRVIEKLRREPVEDFRIDFEDGFGNRPDEEEDGHAKSAAEQVARGFAEGSLPPFIGIRLKPFSMELRDRSIRTLDLFVSALCKATRGKSARQLRDHAAGGGDPRADGGAGAVARGDGACTGPREEARLQFEMMVETTQAILNERGESSLPRFLDAAGGRCIAAHFGTYDYTASCSITAAYQGDGSSGVRLRQAHDASRVRRHGPSGFPMARRTCCPHRRIARKRGGS